MRSKLLSETKQLPRVEVYGLTWECPSPVESPGAEANCSVNAEYIPCVPNCVTGSGKVPRAPRTPTPTTTTTQCPVQMWP